MMKPSFSRSNFMLLDPENPKADPNQLLGLRRGQMADPHAMNHNCPCCHRTMDWELFQAHAYACYTKWRKVVRNTKGRVFTSGITEAKDA